MTLEARRYPPRVRILYEDSRASTNGFGLHDFVLANVHDVVVEAGIAHRIVPETVPADQDPRAFCRAMAEALTIELATQS